jgi:hypothetical protein
MKLKVDNVTENVMSIRECWSFISIQLKKTCFNWVIVKHNLIQSLFVTVHFVVLI